MVQEGAHCATEPYTTSTVSVLISASICGRFRWGYAQCLASEHRTTSRAPPHTHTHTHTHTHSSTTPTTTATGSTTLKRAERDRRLRLRAPPLHQRPRPTRQASPQALRKRHQQRPGQPPRRQHHRHLRRHDAARRHPRRRRLRQRRQGRRRQRRRSWRRDVLSCSLSSTGLRRSVISTSQNCATLRFARHWNC
jgi:hypothetical protein